METKQYPKSYLDPVEREALMREGGMHAVCIAESQEADDAGDFEAGWAWLAATRLSASNLRKLKIWYGADFIRKYNFDTTNADKEMGSDWLDK